MTINVILNPIYHFLITISININIISFLLPLTLIICKIYLKKVINFIKWLMKTVFIQIHYHL